jgi:hypothetical protein
MPKIPVRDVLSLLYDLQHHSEAQQQEVASRGLDQQLSLLRDWQSQRLQDTYTDLLSIKKYRPACEFFLSDIYAPRDFSQRDYDAQRLHEILSRYLSASTLYLLADALRMNQLTNDLDHQLLRVLTGKLGVTDSITPQVYAEGYRLCDNYDQRQEQIDLLVQILNEVGKLARNPIVGVASHLARIPARRAGWHEIYDFLERGYAALRRIRNLTPFINTIERREIRILERIYAGHPQPFER